MNKDTCDHCDTNKVVDHAPDELIVWCGECVRADYQLLNQAQLINDSGQTLTFHPGEGQCRFGNQDNIDKLKLIPKRGLTTVQVIGIDLAAKPESTEPPPPPVVQLDSDWFERYNSLDSLPGRRHYE